MLIKLNEKDRKAKAGKDPEKCTRKKVLIIGDFCLDAYWDADMSLSQLSLETPRFPWSCFLYSTAL